MAVYDGYSCRRRKATAHGLLTVYRRLIRIAAVRHAAVDAYRRRVGFEVRHARSLLGHIVDGESRIAFGAVCGLASERLPAHRPA